MQVYMFYRHLFGPYDAEIVQEMTIEEAKRRYPDEKIPEKEGKLDATDLSST